MKILKSLNITIIIVTAILLILIYITDNENIIYSFPIVYLTLYIAKKIIINRVLNNNVIVIRIKSKRFYEYAEYILSVVFGIFLIYNFWGRLAFKHDAANLLFALIGIILLIESTQSFFYRRLFLTNELISFTNGKGLSEWSKINAFEVKGKKLILRTSSRNFWFRFDDIDKNDADKIVSIFNQKLSNIFNGTLIYDKGIIITGNKA